MQFDGQWYGNVLIQETKKNKKYQDNEDEVRNIK